MPQTSRELVSRCLRFDHPARVPRELWTLPWADQHHPQAVAELRRRFPDDTAHAPDVCSPGVRQQGDPYAIGTYVDEWGCRWTNVQAGVVGEVRDPLIEDLADWRALDPPYEILPTNWTTARDQVNRFCAASDRFVRMPCRGRPWERYQFIRGPANAYLDMAAPDADVRGLLRRIHEFYLRDMEFWVTTDIDCISFMDDWGAQDRLLISPERWRELFKPLYREYCDLARAHGKFAFMHSDGHILSIYPDLIEIGVSGVNSQLFCMDRTELVRVAKGRITFWGEIDRQHVLPSRDPQAGRDAVRAIVRDLYDPSGGVLAQFEFGPAANPETALAIFEEWDRVGC
ncbi:MAG: methyltransferase [Lentisphaerae bacterium]|nr:methyltransferase [Lentisphaerota bacterium]